MSLYLVVRFDRHTEMLDCPFLISNPVGDSLLVEYVYHDCEIIVGGRVTLADLIVLDMIDFNLRYPMNLVLYWERVKF